MTNDLISRSDLKKAIEPYRYATDGMFEGISLIIDNAPTVEERPKGEFEKIELYRCEFDAIVIEQRCSVCKRWSIRWAESIPSKFCSYCGADMRGKADVKV